MECVICKNGTTIKGKVTITFEKKEAIIVIKDVPANICNNCENYFLDSDIAKKVLAKANEELNKGALFEVTSLRVA